MAAFELVAGRKAVFLVVPLLGAVAIWATYRIGGLLLDVWAGAIGAVLLLVSPTFLWMLVQPMSDVPVMACWATSLIAAMQMSPTAPAFAGAAAALALLIRPNTLPVAIVPVLLVLSASPRTTPRIRRAALVIGPVVAAAVLIAALNALLYGSPLKSGYGSLSDLYSIEYVVPNTKQYASWFSSTQTPLAFLWLAAPLLAAGGSERLRLLIITVIYPLLVYAMYAAYLPWHEWWYLRFLLPAFPVVCAAVGAVMVAVIKRFHRSGFALAAIFVVFASVVVHEWRFGREAGVFRYATDDQRFVMALEFANALPRDAVLVSVAYSGTLNFYSGRDVLRWEVVAPEQFDEVLTYLRRHGHTLYFIGDPSEEVAFKSYFATTDAAARFDAGRIVTGGVFVAADLTPRE